MVATPKTWWQLFFVAKVECPLLCLRLEPRALLLSVAVFFTFGYAGAEVVGKKPDGSVTLRLLCSFASLKCISLVLSVAIVAS